MIIYAQSTPQFKICEGNLTLADMQSAVGGYIQILSSDTMLPSGEAVDMVINEEGKLMGLPLNVAATIIAWTYFGLPEDDCIVGPAMFVGREEDGNSRYLTEEEQMALVLAFDEARMAFTA